jgi:hypothetical protein
VGDLMVRLCLVKTFAPARFVTPDTVDPMPVLHASEIVAHVHHIAITSHADALNDSSVFVQVNNSKFGQASSKSVRYSSTAAWEQSVVLKRAQVPLLATMAALAASSNLFPPYPTFQHVSPPAALGYAPDGPAVPSVSSFPAAAVSASASAAAGFDGDDNRGLPPPLQFEASTDYALRVALMQDKTRVCVATSNLSVAAMHPFYQYHVKLPLFIPPSSDLFPPSTTSPRSSTTSSSDRAPSSRSPRASAAAAAAAAAATGPPTCGFIYLTVSVRPLVQLVWSLVRAQPKICKVQVLSCDALEQRLLLFLDEGDALQICLLICFMHV